MIGKYAAKMDDKNRLFVPAKLREELGGEFYVTIGVNCGHRCLTAFPAASWNDVCAKYDQLSLAQRSAGASVIFMLATECVPDKQFRISLTPTLMNYAGITRDVVIVGRAGQAEIWDVAEFEAFENENLSPEKLLESLEAIGL